MSSTISDCTPHQSISKTRSMIQEKRCWTKGSSLEKAEDYRCNLVDGTWDSFERWLGVEVGVGGRVVFITAPFVILFFMGTLRLMDYTSGLPPQYPWVHVSNCLIGGHYAALAITLLTGVLFLLMGHYAVDNALRLTRITNEDNQVRGIQDRNDRETKQTPTAASRETFATRVFEAIKKVLPIEARGCIFVARKGAPAFEMTCWIVAVIFPDSEFARGIIAKSANITFFLIHLGTACSTSELKRRMENTGSYVAWFARIWEFLHFFLIVAGLELRKRSGISARIAATAPALVLLFIGCLRDGRRASESQGRKKKTNSKGSEVRHVKKDTDAVTAALFSCNTNRQESDNQAQLFKYREKRRRTSQQAQAYVLEQRNGDTEWQQDTTLEDSQRCDKCVKKLDEVKLTHKKTVEECNCFIENQEAIIAQQSRSFSELSYTAKHKDSTIEYLKSKLQPIVQENQDGKAEIARLRKELETCLQCQKVARLESQLQDVAKNRDVALKEHEKHAHRLQYLVDRQSKQMARLRRQLSAAQVRATRANDKCKEEVRKLNEDLSRSAEERNKEKEYLEDQWNAAWSSAVYHSRHLEGAENKVRDLEWKVRQLEQEKEYCVANHEPAYVCVGEKGCQREDCFWGNVAKAESSSENPTLAAEASDLERDVNHERNTESDTTTMSDSENERGYEPDSPSSDESTTSYDTDFSRPSVLTEPFSSESVQVSRIPHDDEEEDEEIEMVSSPEISTCGDDLPELIRLDSSGDEMERDLVHVSDMSDESAKLQKKERGRFRR